MSKILYKLSNVFIHHLHFFALRTSIFYQLIFLLCPIGTNSAYFDLLQILNYKQTQMITLIISALCFVALVVLCCFIPLQNNKTLIMAGIVMIMLLATIIDELVLPKYPLSKLQTAQHFQTKPLSPHQKLNISTQLYKNTPARQLLKQQRTLLQYLIDKQTSKQNIVLHIKNIDNSRFRAVFREFQLQTNVPALFLQFGNRDYSFSQIQTAFTQGKGTNRYKDKIVYFVIGGINCFNHVVDLENIFLMYNVSYIVQDVPRNLFQMSALGKWTHRYEFQGSYISQVLQNHPPKLVQICNKYRTIDYPFYVMSQTEPLSELCTKLPSNEVTECIKKYLTKVEDRVPYSKVRKCFHGRQNEDVDGVIYENGMIGLKKDFFYAGKVDRALFAMENQIGNQNL